jgi:hypothetical protein
MIQLRENPLPPGLKEKNVLTSWWVLDIVVRYDVCIAFIVMMTAWLLSRLVLFGNTDTTEVAFCSCSLVQYLR